jgi:N-methylhydantoinase A/oxoprolinase/acetone carboxylase beta subunit
MPFRLGVDIGGTFTDFVLEDVATGTLYLGKTLTTPRDPAAAVVAGIRRLLADHGVPAGAIAAVIHGTTLATNAVIERQGARTGLLTTAGFTDVLAIAREARYDHYDLQLQPPEPLVPRERRRGVVERIASDGAVVTPIAAESVAREAATLVADGCESIAVAYLHAYKNPAHERATAAALATAAPGVAVSLSSDVAPELREYERTSTTVLNAYLQPVLERYLEALENDLRAIGIAGAFLLMLSDGLLATARMARRFPARLIESGPAGGAMLGAFYARLCGRPNLVAFDMGGTTAKATLIHDGDVPVAREFEVARVERFKRGSGFPVRVPCVEIEEIGTGGGSIAWIDGLGQLAVGPRSAGSEPGPACYGRGGMQPTVTDADLVLGYLNPDYFLGGAMRLDGAAAAAASERTVARPLGLNVVNAAWGIHRVANEDMASAFRIHAMEHGRDPARHVLLSFGGAGPVHAWGVARILRSPEIVVPAAAGVASALGFLVAPIAAETSRSYLARLDRADWRQVQSILAELEAQGRDLLAEAGVAGDDIVVTRAADMQYVGQMHDIAVPVPPGALGADIGDRMRAAFEARYLELFQRTVSRIPIEALTWRVKVSAPAPAIDLRWRGPRAAAAAGKGERPLYFPEANGFVAAAVYDRYALKPGDTFAGPAIVEERESTLVVGPGGRGAVDDYGSLIVRVPAPFTPEAS